MELYSFLGADSGMKEHINARLYCNRNPVADVNEPGRGPIC